MKTKPSKYPIGPPWIDEIIRNVLNPFLDQLKELPDGTYLDERTGTRFAKDEDGVLTKDQEKEDRENDPNPNHMREAGGAERRPRGASQAIRQPSNGGLERVCAGGEAGTGEAAGRAAKGSPGMA